MTLLHMTTGPAWRAALDSGGLEAESLSTQGFVHLSTPEQVHLPANRLYAGRSDLVLVCLDPQRLTGPLRWEPGVPGDPESMRFPHLYAPVPTAAAIAVVPYRPDVDGRFTPPSGVPRADDAAGRAIAWYRHFPVRRARAVVPVTGGVAVLDERHPVSHENNRLLIRGPLAVDTVVGEAERVLGALAHRTVTVDDPGLAAGLGQRGWVVQPLVLMATPVPCDVAVARVARIVDQREVHPLWRAGWRAAGLSVAAADALVAREATNDEVVLVLDVAVHGPSGAVISSAQLRVDGATAALEAVMTDPAQRGHGHAADILRAVMTETRGRGVDLIVLEAAADDWPRHWYARLGFREVARMWECTRR